MDYAAITEQVIALTKEVGAFVKAERDRLDSTDVEIKGLGDYVSRADKESEQRLRAGLLEILPGSTVMAEEDSPEAREDTDWRWIVDPIDGTSNYLAGLPAYAVSVALEDRRQRPERFGPMVIGVVEEPALHATYDAFKDGGARRNGQPIHVRTGRLLEHALVATAFPFRQRQRLEIYLSVFQHIYPRIADFRRVGSAAADLCWVADGTWDGYFEMGLKPWDVAAGELIIREAGGVVSDWWGYPVEETGWTVCGNRDIYTAIRESIDHQGIERPTTGLFR